MSSIDSTRRVRNRRRRKRSGAHFRSGGDKTGRWTNPYLRAVKVELVFCHYCGYGPEKIPPGGICPKCGKAGWERSVVSRRLIPEEA